MNLNIKKHKKSFHWVTVNNRQAGAAMLISIVFFLFISLAIITGLTTPVIREYKNIRTDLNSKKAYFLAESGSEDAYYRIAKNKPVSVSEVLTLGTNSVTTTTTNVSSSQKSIVALGDVDSYQRKVALSLSTGAGVVFKYGTQAGQGGIRFKNNASLFGSLYSNGDVIGSGTAVVTGDVYVANSPALVSNQSNGDNLPPPNNIIFGNANTNQDFAQSFQLGSNGLINKVQFYIRKVGSPGNATIRITTSDGTSPTNTNVATGTLNANLVTANYGWIDVNFSTNPQMIQGIEYWLVIDASTNVNNYYTIAGNNSYINGTGKIGQNNGTWNNTNPVGLDGYFSLFLGGVNGLVSGMTIGQNGVGNLYANTANNNTIAGTAYCQSGSGNNKVCDASRPDPTPENLPISDANIDEWKADALAGGVINGDYTISGDQTFGQRKIVGNLTVSGVLTVSDTIWVTGNLIISGTIKLAPSYAATSGIIIADGYINVNNGSVFVDSGTSGSYILLLSTSSCDEIIVGNPCGDSNAINVDNNSDLIIVNAQNGAISFKNNSGVKEMVANRIHLANGATVTYGSGLSNVDFSSGPSGSWNINTWQESE